MKQGNIDSKTCLYGVIGDPISHSLSPAMHNSAFSHIGYNGAYLAFNVKDVAAAVSGVRGLDIKGLSVTIPHKIKVMDYLDEIDDDALKIGAVNTIVNKGGHLYGYNSDCLGAVNALREKTEIKGKNVVVVGAGGAARAIGFGILSEGANLTIVNILEDEGTLLAKDLGVEYYHLSDFNKVDYQVLINATPVGMTPDTGSMPVKKEELKEGAVVMDIIYNPLKTRLLSEAENSGCDIIDGVSMFVYQGVSQFESWTGEKAPVDIMRSTVLDALSTR
ncbi:MAG: shikimate dehydrogenase [Desulfobacterales bacterium]|nr:shikimate dehydrogenase [Desulfobacteraceae bacterium]MBT4365484.1 shikimate dehydrogenase [Desulfobacteraceae bacterium]MBT7087050.1 shikimate dehydrogenase [Desulfobacterales bacterium]MBT7697585.1 shikimate dehydrogenase [Desulfobacterales bacterium]